MSFCEFIIVKVVVNKCEKFNKNVKFCQKKANKKIWVQKISKCDIMILWI